MASVRLLMGMGGTSPYSRGLERDHDGDLDWEKDLDQNQNSCGLGPWLKPSCFLVEQPVEAQPLPHVQCSGMELQVEADWNPPRRVSFSEETSLLMKVTSFSSYHPLAWVLMIPVPNGGKPRSRQLLVAASPVLLHIPLKPQVQV